MGGFKVTPKEIKEQILSRIKNDGINASQAAREAGISVKTVYNWLKGGVVKEPTILDNIRLKKELDNVYLLLGKLTARMEKKK